MEKWSVLWKLGYVLIVFFFYFILKALRDWYYTKEKTKLVRLDDAEEDWQREKNEQIGTGKELLARQEVVRLKKEVKKWGRYWHFVDGFIYGYFAITLTFPVFGISWWIFISGISTIAIRWWTVDGFWNLFAGQKFSYRGTGSLIDSMGKKPKGVDWLRIGMKTFAVIICGLIIFFYYKSLT